VLLNTRVTGIDGSRTVLSNGMEVDARTIVWTAGISANPLLDCIPCQRSRGRLVVNEFLQSPDVPNVWAVGDCASITDLATGDIRQDRMGPMLVSWRLKVPFATAIKAVDTGENPSTRLLIESSLGTRDASRYVIRLPPVLINGEEYILKPIKLELHRFDGGLEPFNC